MYIPAAGSGEVESRNLPPPPWILFWELLSFDTTRTAQKTTKLGGYTDTERKVISKASFCFSKVGEVAYKSKHGNIPLISTKVSLTQFVIPSEF
jgi:hypothetical protein